MHHVPESVRWIVGVVTGVVRWTPIDYEDFRRQYDETNVGEVKESRRRAAQAMADKIDAEMVTGQRTRMVNSLGWMER